MEVVYKNANVYADISGLTLGAFEERFERFALGKVNEALPCINDPDKLLFGSDWPVSDTGRYLQFTRPLRRDTYLYMMEQLKGRATVGPDPDFLCPLTS